MDAKKVCFVWKRVLPRLGVALNRSESLSKAGLRGSAIDWNDLPAFDLTRPAALASSSYTIMV